MSNALNLSSKCCFPMPMDPCPSVNMAPHDATCDPCPSPQIACLKMGHKCWGLFDDKCDMGNLMLVDGALNITESALAQFFPHSKDHLISISSCQWQDGIHQLLFMVDSSNQHEVLQDSSINKMLLVFSLLVERDSAKRGLQEHGLFSSRIQGHLVAKKKYNIYISILQSLCGGYYDTISTANSQNDFTENCC